MLKLTDSTVKWLKNTADHLKGSARRTSLWLSSTTHLLMSQGLRDRLDNCSYLVDDK